MTNDKKYVGLIPAAGYATRLANLPCSKEIFPVRFTDEEQLQHEFPVCKVLIDAYRKANIENICIISREEKVDILETLGNGEQYDVELSYIYTQKTQGAAFTLDKAYAFTEKQFVALGFPDIIFKPDNAFSQLISKQHSSKADVVLGLFPAENPTKMDMIEFDSLNKIHGIHIKPKATTLQWTWILAVWSPSFSKFMHQTLASATILKHANQNNEIHVGHVFQLALETGMQFDSVFINDGKLIDIGTQDDLNDLTSRLVHERWFNH